MFHSLGGRVNPRDPNKKRGAEGGSPFESTIGGDFRTPEGSREEGLQSPIQSGTPHGNPPRRLGPSGCFSTSVRKGCLNPRPRSVPAAIHEPSLFTTPSVLQDPPFDQSASVVTAPTFDLRPGSKGGASLHRILHRFGLFQDLLLAATPESNEPPANSTPLDGSDCPFVIGFMGTDPSACLGPHR